MSALFNALVSGNEGASRVLLQSNASLDAGEYDRLTDEQKALLHAIRSELELDEEDDEGFPRPGP